MKKILFVTSLYHPHVGGIETMVSELANFYGTQAVESVVLTKKWPQTLSAKDENGGVCIYRVVSARSEEEFLNIIDWIKKNEEDIRSDIIHVVGVRRPLPLVALLLARYWNVPIVSTVAGGEIPNTGDPSTLEVWNEGKDLMKPVIELSDAVTVVSKALRNELLKIVTGVSRAQVLYAGIDVGLIRGIPCTETKKDYILSLRRLISSKGIDTLIRAFKMIKDDQPGISLVIAGEGPEERNLKNLVKELEIDDRVDFTGTVSFERSVSLLKGAICTVVPSLSEGGGLVNVEAQAASCPVVASTAGGIPEYVQNNESGLLFVPGDFVELSGKLRAIISDQALRTRLVKGGMVHADKFDWKILGPKYLLLYENCIKELGSARFEPYSELTSKLWKKLIS